ncbi:MAG: FHA domain-containing protein [Clostridia bacterium]
MDAIIAISRYLLPCLTIIILVKCIMTLLLGRAKQTTYAYIIDTSSNSRYALNMWETALGRSNSCDIVLPYEDVAKFQSVICRRNDGWYIYDLLSKNPTRVNSAVLKKRAKINNFDTIKFSTRSFSFRVVDDPVQAGKNSAKAEPQDNGSLPLSNTKKSSSAPPPKAEQGNPMPKRRKPALVNSATKQIHVVSKTPTRIGRAGTSEIKIELTNVAMTHAVLVLYSDGWAIDPVGANSCYLNGSLIKEPQLLFENDIIKIANQRFYYTYNYGSSI